MRRITRCYLDQIYLDTLKEAEDPEIDTNKDDGLRTIRNFPITRVKRKWCLYIGIINNHNAIKRDRIPPEHPEKPGRQVSDARCRNEEKRESACKELEIIIRKNTVKKHYQQIEKMILFFRDKYVKSSDFNKKKSGLEALPFIINGIKINNEAVEKLGGIIIDIILDLL